MENLEVKIRALVAQHSGVSRVLHVDYCGRFIDTAVVIAAIEKLVVSSSPMTTVELRMRVGPDTDELHSCLNVIKSIVVTQTECVSGYHWGRFVRQEDIYGPRYEDIQRRVPKVEKMHRILGVKATTSLEDGVRRTWDWFKALAQ